MSRILGRMRRKSKKKMRTISVDDKRRAEIIARHARWHSIKDHPQHRDAVRLIGPLSEMGAMTIAYTKEKVL